MLIWFTLDFKGKRSNLKLDNWDLIIWLAVCIIASESFSSQCINLENEAILTRSQLGLNYYVFQTGSVVGVGLSVFIVLKIYQRANYHISYDILHQKEQKNLDS